MIICSATAINLCYVQEWEIRGSTRGPLFELDFNCIFLVVFLFASHLFNLQLDVPD